MRVAFNATALLSPLTGIGQYGFQLAKNLATLPGLDLDYFYGAFWDNNLKDDGVTGSAAAALPWLRRHIPYSYELRRWVQNNRFARYAKPSRFDLYHEPNILPLRFDGPTVVTVHDLSWIRYPETHPVERVRAMNRYFEAGLEQASAVITDAQSVKQELLETFGLSPDFVTAIPLGVDATFAPQDAAQSRYARDKHGLAHGRYFLAVGTLEPRKNLSTALLAYQQLPADLRAQYPLVLIGMKGWHTSALERQMAPLLQAGQVRQLGYVSRADLVSLMAGARALIYPSVYEGFGLPPLEAMACATPVICSNASSLPEVVGDAGIMVDAMDDVALSLAMRRLADDEACWLELKHRSLRRAQQFTWAACADKTLAVYQSIVS
jgi:alpha-1,3-rhamnosyl/mannosyltransferase